MLSSEQILQEAKFQLLETKLRTGMTLSEIILDEYNRKVDNFNLVSQYLTYDSPDSFYFVQIIKRLKDNPKDDKSQGNYKGGGWYLKSWRIHSPEELQQLKPEIIRWCEDNNARAYITINPRSTKQTDDFIKITKRVAEPNIDDKVAGAPKYGPSWKGQRLRLFLDIDTKDRRIWKEVLHILGILHLEVLAKYRTPSGGLHILLPNREEPNLYYAKKLFTQLYDRGKDLGKLSTVHANPDGKIILYSNVQTKGY